MRRKKGFIQRILSVLLSLVLSSGIILTSIPSETWAGAASEESQYEIVAFMDLPLEVRQQNVAIGTPLEELMLPDTLMVLCGLETEEPKEAETEETEEAETETEDVVDSDVTAPDDSTKSDSTTPDDNAKSDGTTPGGSADSDSTNPEGDADSSGTNPGGDADSNGTNPGDNADSNSAAPDDNGDSNGTNPGDTADSNDTAPDDNADSNGTTPDDNTDTDGTVPDDNTDSDSTAPGDATDSEPQAGESGDDLPGPDSEPVETNSDENPVSDIAMAHETIIVHMGEYFAEPDPAELQTVSLPDSDDTLEDGDTTEETSDAPVNTEEASDALINTDEVSDTLTDTDEISEAPADTEEASGTVTGAKEELSAIIIEGITWISTPEYNGDLAGVYVFTPVLPEGFILGEGTALPEITVTVCETDMLELLAADSLELIVTRDVVWDGTNLSLPTEGTIIIEPGVTVTIRNTITINGNITITGGGTIRKGEAHAHLAPHGNLTLQGITVDGASLVDTMGMLYVPAGNLTLANCIVRNCTNGGYDFASGGAIQAINGAHVTISGTKFENCSASQLGGAVYLENSNAVIRETTIENCHAGYAGGAIACVNSSVDMYDSTINNCSALYQGGAISTQINTGGNTSTSTFNIHGGTYSNNTTTSTQSKGGYFPGGGGAIANGGILNIYGGTFTGNSTAGAGGCIYQDAAADVCTNIYGGVFYGNGDYAIYDSSVRQDNPPGEPAGSTSLKLSGNAIFSDGDGIYLDKGNGYNRYVNLGSALINPITIHVEAEEGYVIAKGFDGYQAQISDLKRITVKATNGGIWYLELVGNEIRLTATRQTYNFFIYYDNNGAEGPAKVDNNGGQGYTTGATPQVWSADHLSLTGYSFKEWNTQPDGNGRAYLPGQEITIENDDITLYAIFTENSASYTVEHHQQTLDGTGYTLVSTDTLEGTVGHTVTAVPKNYVGFSVNHALSTDSGKVTEDGKGLVLRFYYDRYPYRISFDLNGGSGETPAPQTVLYGNYLQPVVPDPVRDGYSFGGWYKDSAGTDGNEWIFNETVEKNTSELSTVLYAKWISNSSTGNDGTGNGGNPGDSGSGNGSNGGDNSNGGSDNGDGNNTNESSWIIVNASSTDDTRLLGNKRNGQSPITGFSDNLQFFATLAMIAGLTAFILMFIERHGMTEEEKNDLIARLIKWARQGRVPRKLLSLAVIGLLTAYYHSVGKQVIVEAGAC